LHVGGVIAGDGGAVLAVAGVVEQTAQAGLGECLALDGVLIGVMVDGLDKCRLMNRLYSQHSTLPPSSSPPYSHRHSKHQKERQWSNQKKE